jgi:hypothetical protein
MFTDISACLLFVYVLSLFFGSENGGSTFLHNTVKSLPDCGVTSQKIVLVTVTIMRTKNFTKLILHINFWFRFPKPKFIVIRRIVYRSNIFRNRHNLPLMCLFYVLFVKTVSKEYIIVKQNVKLWSEQPRVWVVILSL